MELLKVIMFSGYVSVPGKTQAVSGFRFCSLDQRTSLKDHIINHITKLK